MALDLGDLDEFFDASMLVTIRGKQYRIPPVSAELGLWGRRIAALRMAVPDDASPELVAAAQAAAEQELGPAPIPQGETFAEALLSVPLVAQMVTDKVSDQAIEHLAQVAYARIIGGDQLATSVFRGDDPNGSSPANRQERRATTKAVAKAAKRSRGSASPTMSTATADTTRTPASGSTTKSPRKTAVPAKAAGSRGGGSSSVGHS